MLSLSIQYVPSIGHGILITLGLLICSSVIGLVLSLIFSAIKFYKIPVLNRAVSLFVGFITGTPFLVQLFLIYYGPFQFHWVSHSFVAIPFKSAYFCALLALVCNTTAYSTMLFYGALKNLPISELSAANSLGLSKVITYINILLPRMLTRIFLVYKNEVLMLLKCTSLVSTITVLDVMGVIQQIMNETYQTMPLLLLAGAIYLVLSLCLNYVLTCIEKQLVAYP